MPPRFWKSVQILFWELNWVPRRLSVIGIFATNLVIDRRGMHAELSGNAGLGLIAVAPISVAWPRGRFQVSLSPLSLV